MRKNVLSLLFALIFAVSCGSAQVKDGSSNQEKADPSLKDKIVDYKEYYDDGSLKGEGKALYKIVMNKPVRIKQGPWTMYHKGTKLVMSKGDYLDNLQTGKWTFFNKEGKVSEEGSYIEGATTGDWTIYYPTGEVNWKGRFAVFEEKDDVTGEIKKVGKLDGVRTTFDKAGKVLKTEEFARGKKNGRTQEYYASGTPKVILAFKDDLKNGAINEWYENGKKKTLGSFTNDKPSGSWQMFYSNGILSTQGSFNEGKPEGSWKFFSREGQQMKEGNYKAGLEDGYWTFYEYANGRKMISMELPLKAGMVTEGISRYFENGAIYGEGAVNGIPKGIFQVFKKGQPTGETIEGQNQPEDDPVQNITTKWTGTWKKMKRNGNWTQFYPGTRTKQFEAFYMMDKKSGDYKEYYKDGKIKAEGKYLNDKMNDQWKFYKPDGSVDESLSGLYMLDKKR